MERIKKGNEKNKTMKDLELLLRLCEMGAHNTFIKTSLEEIGKMLKCSKQTASRRLEKLQSSGYIERQHLGKGQQIKITEKGLGKLKEVHATIERLLRKHPRRIVLRGTITDGFGEGRYYMAHVEYRKRFQKALKFLPYPGTLDIKIDDDSLIILEELREKKGKVIEGFVADGRTFGSVKFFPARLSGIEGALIFPERGHHKNAVEFIAPKNLRKTLGLKNGDKVEVRVWEQK